MENVVNIEDIVGSFTPRYETRYSSLFDRFAVKKGSSFEGDTIDEETKERRGLFFTTYYEFYMFAFFVGLYSDKRIPLDSKNATNFRHPLREWGNSSLKRNHGRRSKVMLDHIYMAMVLKSGLSQDDIISYESSGSEANESFIKTPLNKALEEYTNGGLSHIAMASADDEALFENQRDVLYFIRDLKDKS